MNISKSQRNRYSPSRSMDYLPLILMPGLGVWDLNNCLIYVVIAVYMMRPPGLGALSPLCPD